ncbi:hypothetical protein [Streptomyces montanisoli]|uniref:LPXTG cell wall anchor domain-containing protein n=1 Tax=Streptomyces montanisoli TaxID=2798581 RepID=A0A940RU27_9ACTN|nr:hypothetical protein [Streptomyces montanisoli]MBP0456786.1 hypothetical protein [Streptomyces montanisoli]
MNRNETRTRVRTRSLLAASFTTAALALCSSTAFAAGPAAVQGPSKADLARAAQAASTGQSVSGLSAFFSHLDARAAGHTGLVAHAEKAPAAAAEHPRVDGSAQAVYVLNPAFVKGDSASAPVARFAFAAVGATSAEGRTASVWLGKDQHTGRWSVINRISGSDEVSYPRQGRGDLVFSEPQTDAWYRVHGGRVLPLNGSARQEVGARGVSQAAYQKLVHGRYADKMAGSAYQKAGELGGFPTGTRAAASGHRTASGTPAELAAGGGLAAALACGGVWLLRRRRGAAA